jgi:hypothetical protein
LKERAWYALSFQVADSYAAQAPAPPLNVVTPGRSTRGFVARGRVDWTPTPSDRMMLSLSADPSGTSFLDGNGATAMKVTPLAARHERKGSLPVAILQWERNITDSSTARVQVGYQRYQVETGPQGWLSAIDASLMDPMFTERTYQYARPAHQNQDDGTVWFNSTLYSQDLQDRLSSEGTFTLRGEAFGQHEAMVGVQSQLMARHRREETPGGKWYVDRGGDGLDQGLCDESTGRGCFLMNERAGQGSSQTGFSLGAFAQDRWRPLRALLVLPGLRFDYGEARLGSGAPSAIKYALSPRLGLLVDVTGDQRTILTGFYGRSSEVFSLASANAATPNPTVRTHRWDPALRTWSFVSANEGLVLVDVTDPRPPTADQVQVGLRREVTPKLVGRLEYTYKYLRNLWDRRETNELFDPSGTRVIGYRNGERRSILMLATEPENYAHYQAFDVAFEGLVAPGWEVLLGYTLSFRYGTNVTTISEGPRLEPMMSNPRQTRFYEGFLPGDLRHQLKGRVAYSTRALSVGLSFDLQQGDSFSKLHKVADPNVGADGNILRAPYGMHAEVPNSFESWAPLVLPPLLAANLRASYDLHELVGHHVSVMADVFNAFNLEVPMRLENEVFNATSFGTVLTRQPPLRVQLGLRLTH